MRRFAAAALLLFAAAFAAPPAHATQGLLCRPVAGSGPRIDVVIGALGIAGVRLVERGAMLSTMEERAPLMVRQSWIDEQRLWIDLVDAQGNRDEGRLRGSFVRRGRFWHVAGTFARGGRVYRVRCEES